MTAPRVVAIVGPTASGKTSLSLELARALDGEVLSCDSMQVYRGMDIGTGKATPAERAEIPHHLLDLIDPGDPMHAERWAEGARAAIADVTARGRLPILCGGTGLYFRALIKGLFQAPPPDPEIRARHKAEATAAGVPALHARLAAIDPAAAGTIMPNDLLRISRALEIFEQTGVPITRLWQQAPQPPPLDLFTLILDPPLDALRVLIGQRVDAMMNAGFLDEVRRLRAAGFGETRALQGLGYRPLGAHLDGTLGLVQAIEETKRTTGAYARRQRTWFRKEVPTMLIERAPTGPQRAGVLDAVRAWRDRPVKMP